MKLERPKVLWLVCCFVGCGGDPATESAGAVAADGGPAEVTEFIGGEFQLRVNAVTDSCLDGGLTLVFMPDGKDKPYALQYPTYLPGFDELPHTYAMKLAAPFQDMQLTMQREGAGMAARAAPQNEVLLSLPGSADCRADMRIDAQVSVSSADAVSLDALVEIIAFNSPTDTCPAVEAVPCQVSLSMSGERLVGGRSP